MEAKNKNGKRGNGNSNNNHGPSTGASKKKLKLKQSKAVSSPPPAPSNTGLLKINSFDALAEIDDQEIVLNENDSIDEQDEEKSTAVAVPSTTDTRPKEDIKDNADFIGFDFSDSEPEQQEEHFSTKEEPFEYDNFDDEQDNDYLSGDDEDNTNTYHRAKPKSKINSEYPWLQNHDHTSKMEIVDWLNLEIKDFVQYISPSKKEISIRNDAYKRIKYMIMTQLWQDCDVQAFGSFATDLYLPGSDIDMVIISPQGKYDTRQHLYQLSAFLRKSGLGVQVETIAHARVPIIKFVESESKIHIDISFERTNGLTAARNIRKWIDTTPGLRELVLIVKQFLSVRKLNNVHVGGLGGYSIICLVYSFLKTHPRLSTESIDPMENLGLLLIEFFELYGLNFGYDDVAVAFDKMTKEPMYVPKRLFPDLMSQKIFSIAIRDPDDVSNNLSRGSFNIKDIKRSFGGAFQLLINKCYELNEASYKHRLNQSILGDVIKYKGKIRDFEDARNDITNEAMIEYSDTPSLPPYPSELRKKKKQASAVTSSTTTTDSLQLPPTQAKQLAAFINQIENENGDKVTKNRLKRIKQAAARKTRKIQSAEQGEEQESDSDDDVEEVVDEQQPQPGRSINDVHYYSEYSSSSENENETEQIAKLVDESNDTTKKSSNKDKEKAVNALFGIKSDSETEQQQEPVVVSDDDEDDDDDNAGSRSRKGSLSRVDKMVKRNYWNQKGGL